MVEVTMTAPLRSGERGDLDAAAHAEQGGAERGDLDLGDPAERVGREQARAAQRDAGEESEDEQWDQRWPLGLAGGDRGGDPLDDADGGDDGGQHEHPGELDDDRGGEHGRPGGAGGGDDLADLVDAGAGPDAELHSLTARAVRCSSGSSDQRDGAEERDHRDGDGDVLLVRAGGLLHGGDGRGAADRDAGADEQAPGGAEPHPPAQPGGEQQGGHQGDHDDRDDREPEGGDGTRRRRRSRAGPRRPAAASWSAGRVRSDCWRGSRPTLAATTPSADRPGEDADRGHQPVTEEGRAEAERQDDGDEGGGCATRSTAGGAVASGEDVIDGGSRSRSPPGHSSRLRILPVAVIGSASTNSTMRGYL